MPISVDKLARGKFQDNIVFTQWLYTYATKYGVEPGTYPGYEKRLEALNKQSTYLLRPIRIISIEMKVPTMNSYLIPNKAFLNMKDRDEEEDEEPGITVKLFV
jgi:hypothetical protein